jgi:hypothetical protein
MLSLREVAARYDADEEAARRRRQRLSPQQTLEFSLACESQETLRCELATKGLDPELMISPPCTRWAWRIQQQTSYLLLLRLTSHPVLHQAWVVTDQSSPDTLELQSVERYAQQLPRLHLQEHMKWYVSYNACSPPGLVVRRYRCSAVAGRPSQKDAVDHFSPWLIHSQSADLLVLHTLRWFRAHRNDRLIVGAHRSPHLSGTPPNTPRWVT